jgi:hypothetical protein
MAIAKEAMMLAVVGLAMCTACGGSAAIPVDASRDTSPEMEAAPARRDGDATDDASHDATDDAYPAVGDAAADDGRAEGAAGCDYANPRRKYVAKNASQCAAVDFACSPPQVPFQDDCGCGCATP